MQRPSSTFELKSWMENRNEHVKKIQDLAFSIFSVFLKLLTHLTKHIPIELVLRS